MKSIILACLITISTFAKANAQQLKGVATYQSQRSIDLKLDDKKKNGMNAEMHKQIQEQIKKQFQKEYTLSFIGSESTYKQEESLAPPAPTNNGIIINVTGNRGITYHDIENLKLLKETEIMSKSFLIADSLKKPKWNMKKEIKNIGAYTCFKAVLLEEYKQPSFDEETGARLDSVTKTRTTTAWYTLDIPVQHGPDKYWGLPGLILEVSDGKFSLMCTKVVLNPNDKILVEIPKKGKQVTKKEYEQIQEDKMEEMMQRHGGKRGKNGSRVFTTTEIIRN